MTNLKELNNLFQKSATNADNKLTTFENAIVFFKQEVKRLGNDRPSEAVEVANFLQGYIHFIRLKAEAPYEVAPLYFYNPDKGCYVCDDELIRDFIQAIKPSAKKATADHVLYIISHQVDIRATESDYTALGNRLYNAKTGQLTNFTADVIVTRKIDTDYPLTDLEEPKHKGKRLTEILLERFGNDEEVYNLFIQIVRACATGDSLGKIFWFYGEGGTGKGSLQQLIINLVGFDNVASLKIDVLDSTKNKSNFALSQLINRSVVIGDDIQKDVFIKDTSTMFSLATGDIVTIEIKKKTPFSGRFAVTVIQSSNGFPSMKGDINAINRRFRILPFQKLKGEPDKTIKDEFFYRDDVLQYLLKLALDTPKADINPRASQELLGEFQEEMNPPMGFAKSFFTDELESTFLPNDFVFHVFKDYINQEGLSCHYGSKTFHKELKKNLPDDWESVENVSVPKGQILPDGFYPKSDNPNYSRSYIPQRAGEGKADKQGKARGYQKKNI